jgi:hypothetical protein
MATPQASPSRPVAGVVPGGTEQVVEKQPADVVQATDQESAEAQQVDGEPTETEEDTIDWHAFVPTDTADHLATMDRAARESGCGVPWQLLAAIARVESDFGRNMATSSAGAIGYGQFLPSSWQAFGSEGNAYDYRDALPAIALYLCQSGLARDPRAALFAYNHADWYVDLVLDLAVRYDRMAPGQPVPEVLGVGPRAETGAPLRYAPGRDLRLQTRARRVAPDATWLGVPWRGRTPGQAVSPAALEDTTLGMLRASFGLTGQPHPGAASRSIADRAWDAGLLPLTDDAGSLTLDEIRAHLERGHPVEALVDSKALPGHAPSDAAGEQPVLIIGKTPGHLIVSDPSFFSSLGYGLEVSDEEFAAAWQSAETPRRALAFTTRPKPLAREAHVRTAEPPPIFARVLPSPVSTATPMPVPSPIASPRVLPTLVLASFEARPSPAAAQDDADFTWILPLGAGAFVAAAFALRLRRAGRWSWPPVSAAAPRRSGR